MPDAWRTWAAGPRRQRRQERDMGGRADPIRHQAAGGRRPRDLGRPERTAAGPSRFRRCWPCRRCGTAAEHHARHAAAARSEVVDGSATRCRPGPIGARDRDRRCPPPWASAHDREAPSQDRLRPPPNGPDCFLVGLRQQLKSPRQWRSNQCQTALHCRFVRPPGRRFTFRGIRPSFTS